MAFLVRAGRLASAGRNIVVSTQYLRSPSISLGGVHRLISTSKKNEETATVAEKLPSHAPAKGHHPEVDAAVASAARRKWMSLGFSYTNEAEDVAISHLLFFAMITMIFVGGAYFYIYAPDRMLRDWAQREAYLTIRDREAKGLPFIDPNMVDPAKMDLPSDEELGEFEIIV